MLSLADRVIMVSGANRGIGLEIAKRLHSDGATLSLGARDVDQLAGSTAAIDDDLVLRHRYDALAEGSETTWVQTTIDRFGHIDGLVNCAGIFETLTLDSEDDSALDRLFAVNVKAPYRLTRAALPHLRDSGSGRIVNISSMSGVRVSHDEVGYSMSKYAMTALSHTTRKVAWDDGVRVTNVCPGYVATPMPLDLDPTLDLETVIQPEDLAELISTTIRLPNTAAVAQLNVTCRWESTV